MNITFYIGLTTKDGLEILDFCSLAECRSFITRLLKGYGIDGWNLSEAIGGWNGVEEDCLNLNVDGVATPADAQALAADLAKGFDQDAVAWVEHAPLNFEDSSKSTLIPERSEAPASFLPTAPKTYRIQSWCELDGCWMEASTTCTYTNNAFKFGAANALKNEPFDYRGTTYRLVDSDLPSLKGEIRVTSPRDTVDYCYNGAKSLKKLTYLDPTTTGHKVQLNELAWDRIAELLKDYSLNDLISK